MDKNQWDRIEFLFEVAKQGTDSSLAQEINNVMKQYSNDKRTVCLSCPSAVSNLFKRFLSWWGINRLNFQPLFVQSKNEIDEQTGFDAFISK